MNAVIRTAILHFILSIPFYYSIYSVYPVESDYARSDTPPACFSLCILQKERKGNTLFKKACFARRRDGVEENTDCKTGWRML